LTIKPVKHFNPISLPATTARLQLCPPQGFLELRRLARQGARLPGFYVLFGLVLPVKPFFGKTALQNGRFLPQQPSHFLLAITPQTSN
jgi:hypothetical protein